MPKLCVVHLSDIHLSSEKDSCLQAVDAISAACRPFARDADACLLALTGDIAYAGSAAEYTVASEKLLKPLIAAIRKETERPVYLSVAPGNHDCVLKPANPVRETVIEAVIAEPSKAEDEQFVEHCCSAQASFFAFADEICEPGRTQPSKLFWQQDFIVGDKCVRVSTLNAAWMSRLPETQGKLVFPISRFEEFLGKEACLHLGLVHHPFNWYGQSAYHELRKRLRRSCTAVLSGHEHQGNVGKIEEQLSGTSLFFESAALHPHEKDAEAGFSLHTFDLTNQVVFTQPFKLEGAAVVKSGPQLSHSWTDESLVHGALDLTQQFADRLNDAGGNFTHAAKERLKLDDVFVWPDVRVWESDNVGKPRVQSSSDLVSQLEGGKQLIVYGDEKSGKTTLLYWYYRELLAHGYAPVFVSAGDLNLKSPTDAGKRIYRAIEAQYKNPAQIETFPKHRRVLLIDDVDRLKSGLHTLPDLLEYTNLHFTAVCATAASSFEVTNLTSKEAGAALAPFNSFDLLKFGLKLRHQLIKKWCSLSVVQTKTELDSRVDDVEGIVNSVIGKRLVPEHPLYLLILLQSCEQHRHGEIQNSGLSFYYQYLITKSLGEVGVKPIELDEHFNYLSLVAWRFSTESAKELDRSVILEVNQEFSRRFISVDLDRRLELLTKARLLSKNGDCYSFAYPYVYYFFIGRYLAKNLEDPAIKLWVEESCKKLYLRDRAHAIMFLTHHAENAWVIRLICDVMRGCFSETAPMELNGDTAYLNDLVVKSSQLTIAGLDVDKNQSVVRQFRDELNEHQDQSDDDESLNDLSFTSKWNLLHKTAEILGVILKNNYGSLERPQKQEMIVEVFDGPLRAMRLWLEAVMNDMDDFVRELRLAEHIADGVPADVAEKRIKQQLFNVLGWVATGVIAASGNFVTSDKLKEDVNAVVTRNPTNAYRLIEAASRLLKPGHVNIDELKKLAKDLDGNPYAFHVLQHLGFYHMYLFHTSETQKQALSKVLNISFEQAKAIEIRKSVRTMN